jgi:ring-1,2-phenylacetyl-CoA epoxidase subunit PaaC
VIRLGDGTEESKERIQTSLDELWRYTGELFWEDDVDQSLKAEGIIPEASELKTRWNKIVEDVLNEATLEIPQTEWQFDGGRRGLHSEHLGYILTELQFMQRAYPNMEW